MLIWIGSITGALFFTILVFIVWTIQRKDNDNDDNGGFNTLRLTLIIIGVFVIVGLSGVFCFQLFGKLGWISKITASNSAQITDLTTNVNTLIKNQDALSNGINKMGKEVQEARKEATHAKNFAQKAYEEGREIRKNQHENIGLMLNRMNRSNRKLDALKTDTKQNQNLNRKVLKAIQKSKKIKDIKRLIKSTQDLKKAEKKILELLQRKPKPKQHPKPQKPAPQIKPNQIEGKIDSLLAGQEEIKSNQDSLLDGQKVTGQQIQNSTRSILDELKKCLEASKRVVAPPQ